MTKATIGLISHGTLRTEDLLASFADELETLGKNDAAHYSDLKVSDETFQAWLRAQSARDKLIGAARAIDPDSDDASELVSNLQDALNEYAPPYCYFGAHEGDGSDFGFWPIWDAIDELPHVQDSDEAKALGEDCKFVNDHGNVTIYGGDGSVIWDCV